MVPSHLHMKDKIVSLELLADRIAELKAQGKKVAHCHGCFDLLHLGHIKHFEAAREAADALVVTITPDHHVNKGPGRPVFNEQMRLETLASLEVVDFVALNRWPTAIELLKLVKPTYYVKGQDYRDFGEDLTGNIAKEVAAVRSVGGDVYFTDEVTFSSSKLINENFSPLSETAQEFLYQFKEKHSPDDIIAQIESLSEVRVLVIGDTIIDEYHYVHPLGKSSKSPTLSTKFHRAQNFAGGVLAIANHLNEFAGKAEMISVLGRENDQIEVIAPNLHTDIETRFFYREDGPTPTKRRYLTQFQNSKIFEVTFMNDQYLPPEVEDQIIQYLESRLPELDVVMIADFGHGLITPRIQQFLAEADIFVAVNAQTNSNNFGYNYITKYLGCDYISIDENELRLPFGERYGELETLVQRLTDITGCQNVTITLGGEGALYYHAKEFYRVPAMATSVVDSVGAGDAVLSVSSLLAYQGCSPEILPYIGNCVGALAVQIIGNQRPVNKVELNKMISHMLK
jgi:rfaE bifunctional protein kinase chain/domain/rfaE bifunctional protein nucleotidyltransferase chain/domain